MVTDERTFDLTEREVEDGVYEAKIVKAENHTSKKGNTCLKMSLSLTDPDLEGFKLTKYITIENADGRKVSLNPIRQLARAVGEPVAEFSLGEQENGEYTKFKGIDVRVKVKNEEDESGWPVPGCQAILPYSQE